MPFISTKALYLCSCALCDGVPDDGCASSCESLPAFFWLGEGIHIPFMDRINKYQSLFVIVLTGEASGAHLSTGAKGRSAAQRSLCVRICFSTEAG